MAEEPRQQPWDPQPREGAEAFAAFRAYLEMVPKRNIPAAAKALGKSHQQLYRWSSRYHWVNRALAWDAEKARERDADLRGERLEVRRGLLQRGKEAETVGRVLTRAGLRPDEYGGQIKIPPAECLRLGDRFLRLANESEAQALGIEEPEQTEQSVVDKLFGLDSPALGRVIEEAIRLAPGSGEETGGGGEQGASQA